MSTVNPHRPPPRRSLSLPGVTAMLTGLSLIGMELRYQLLVDRMGLGGRVILLLAGGWMSVWGLKEVIAAWWPGLGSTQARRRHRFKMPIEGYVYVIVMIVLFVGSLLGRSNPLMLVFALLAGPFVVNGGITFSMLRGLRVERKLPERVMASEPFSVEVSLINPKYWLSAWLMTVRDRVDNGQEFLNPEILFTCVRGRQTQTGRYQLRLRQRGRYKFGPLQVNSRFPLGLVERGLVLSADDEILVYPEVGRLSSNWRRQLLSATQLVNNARARVGSFHDDFHRIREYRSGDEPRTIHWRTTARRNELMVREFRESRDRHLNLLLDAWVPPRATAEQHRRVEYAISLAATIALDYLRNGRGDDLFVAMIGRAFREWGGSTPLRERDELLDQLALLQPAPSKTLEPLLQAAHREQTPHTRTVLVTPDRQRAQSADWGTVAAEGSPFGRAWSDPPLTLVADPAELGDLFMLDSTTSPVSRRPSAGAATVSPSQGTKA